MVQLRLRENENLSASAKLTKSFKPEEICTLSSNEIDQS